ncbi:hypothetical protein TBLA_0A00620 [Henningerozyma blattae CBS 6284]|uniref:5-oxoprolinase n=1 Tax=Henningerozyma blattae (strain ATCC 34711 / CBS 6284 / DSM 70876 / NBRC 10599 / NRRL Y-10934 / UCD 77-7) TaxID=1071380 RepID=I2GUR1_HENB6|nr:hypothetical protein TBLA_0A00620 [Tetrapisispora blattae CBS 6284]CCH57863.1 hypothetical protein TBLA_0A00620 [Tetrapisispora blattae CBS 6284]
MTIQHAQPKIRIAIDRGGTFTDCIANPGTNDEKDDIVLKLLSVDPKNYSDAPLEGIRRILEKINNVEIKRNSKLDISNVKSIRIGTTLATNCALERNGERCALITSKGFKDSLLIGDQTRPNIFDLNIKKIKPLYDIVVECNERITLEDYSEDPYMVKSIPNAIKKNTFQGISGEIIRVLQKPNPEEIYQILKPIHDMGIESLAIAFMHSYTFNKHELIVREIARDIGFKHITLSSEVSPMIKFLPRANSTVVDAYLTPVIKKYRDDISNGLMNVHNSNIQFMQSDGGLVDGSKFSGLKSILSGPAGGVVGYSQTCYDPIKNKPLIGFDMGGTSTDVSRFGDGKLEHVFETTTAGILIQSPQLDINTVASGGSSKLFWENGLFRVGPESAAADPGPAAYRKGGPLTITDANLFLGRLIPEFFPKIFGPNENESLDLEITAKKFKSLTTVINQDLNSNMTAEEVAYGFIQVANATMARPIRALTESKGHIVSNHRLVSFGGAGGQHAIFVAELLGIKEVLIHRYSSILSAYGIFLADVVEEIQEPCSLYLKDENIEILNEKFLDLMNTAIKNFSNQGINDNNAVVFEKYLNLRYEGAETALMINQIDNRWDFVERFSQCHKREFGFAFENRNIIVDDVRVRAIAKSNIRNQESIDTQLENYKSNESFKETDIQNYVSFYKKVYLNNNWINTPVFDIKNIPIGTKIDGPAILADNTQTNIIPSNSKAVILNSQIFVEILDSSLKNDSIQNSKEIDPILLSIYGNRFMDIAEQMGVQLRKTSTSTNIKERLDFSCALFDPEGNLVANAPHVPVHLGSMSTCITAQTKIWKDKLRPGDVIFTNHPDVGGTHLPDITVISPAFGKDGKIMFYVASRAHHADIGGILPGSVPPNSKELYEEGAAIYSELLVKGGKFQEDLVYQLFVEEPAKYPGCSGARRITDNINDLKAQVAANTKGIQLIDQMVSNSSYNIILKYMNAIQANAASTIKKMLKQLSQHFNKDEFSGEDYMDDGSLIKLKVKLDIINEKYTFDFTGTSPQIYGNTNAPIAITYSAILYCLRCLVGEDIPLNQGCLEPINVIVPQNSILCPGSGVAVVGGNVLTSQRVTDVIFKTLNVMADSQGDCNNFTFGIGNSKHAKTGKALHGFGYYETICGGSGAGSDSWRGPGWDGTSAVHTNMTNTRMTDPEILERRYPVILRDFSIRKDSRGRGKFSGGNGVVRDIEFRTEVSASILSERRVIPPHGLNGGENGGRGENMWFRKESSSIVNIGGKNTFLAKPGDRIIIKTPGGAGYGNLEKNINA